MREIKIFVLLFLLVNNIYSQNFGAFPKIEKVKLHRDLDLVKKQD